MIWRILILVNNLGFGVGKTQLVIQKTDRAFYFSTIEYLGLWETLHNPKQKSIAYANEADLLNVALFGKTAAEFRAKNPNTKGNIRDEATLELFEYVLLQILFSI